MSEEDPPAKRMRLGGDGLLELSREELIAENKKQESYIASLLSKLDGNCASGPQNELEERLKQQQTEANRKEKVLLMQLTRKEQDLQEVATQLGELTKGNTPGASQLRAALLDPALNLLFQRMRNQLEEKSKKLQQATDDMAAWKFTPDSQTGKRLMSKCRILIQENQELGKQVSTGRTAQLEAELALQKKYSEELKASQDELNEFVIQLDEEVEGMQSTICALQQQLKEAKEDLAALKVMQTEPVNTDQGQTEHQVHEQVVQQQPEQQMKQPESPFTEEGTVSALLSPAQSSPPQIEVVGNKTPEVERTPEGDRTQGGGKEESMVDGSDDGDHRPWIPDEMETAEDSNLRDERTAETNVSPKEEHEITSITPEEEKDRTTKIIKEQVRTFSYEESETHRRQQQEEGRMLHQETGADPRDALQKENQELQDRWQKWDEQEQQQEEEEMEIDSPKCKNDTSSKENEVLPVDAKQSNFAGELTSPVASCESLTDGSNEGINTTTLDHVQTSQNQGVDPAPGDIQNTDQTSLEPSGNNDLGVIDSTGSKGTEESSTKNTEVPDISTKNQDNDITYSLAEEVSKSTVDNQPGIGKAVSEIQGLGKSALLAQFSEVKVTAKKLPTNCSLSVVDYDTGSSEEEDYEGDDDGIVDEPSCPNNQTLPRTKHSPNNQSPESPNQSLSPGNNSPEPVNNTGKLGPEFSPLKNLQIPSNNGDSDVGLLTKSNESQDSDIVEENGTDSIHTTEKNAISTE